MKVPEELFYTKEHEWVFIDGEEGSIGITDHAQKELGDIVFVELPQVGDRFSTDEPFGSVESVKAVSEIYCPVEGEVIAVNPRLVDSPELVNEDPYGSGWMVRIRVEDSSDTSHLMSAAEYAEYLREESEA
jgi:glycine cleavage system H protein